MLAFVFRKTKELVLRQPFQAIRALLVFKLLYPNIDLAKPLRWCSLLNVANDYRHDLTSAMQPKPKPLDAAGSFFATSYIFPFALRLSFWSRQSFAFKD